MQNVSNAFFFVGFIQSFSMEINAKFYKAYYFVPIIDNHVRELVGD